MRGYHKPIMIAGGIGNIDASHTHKDGVPAGSLLIQLGGPGMRIGMGGGAASSMATGTNTADTDFDSVQRGNPRWSAARRGSSMPAGSSATPTPSCRSTTWCRRYLQRLPEIVDGAGRGARFDLRRVHRKSRA